ncbi:MAG: SusC/RagA family TonB-linked outer membrane protein, partial [Gemmatimonadetes bacterium]|nr:SusC/RagA family TonB-linked outer membrane protein [Gemmatimonadota bacterium]
NLANAVSTVSPSELEEAPPVQTAESLLQGRVAGALVEQNSGAPGGGMQVRLRGVSTIIGESEPLYVVDGVLMSNVAIPNGLNAVTLSAGGSSASNQDAPVNRIADLNPADIERIEILKGASAAALYGSRAANGVILITTRRGNPGAARVNLTQRFGFFQRSNELEFRDWTLGEAWGAFASFEGATAADSAGITSFFDGSSPDARPREVFDHQDLIAGESDLSNETALSVSGGDDDTRYFISGTWREDQGVMVNTGYDKQGLRVNLEQSLGDRFSVNVQTNLLHTVAERGISNNDNSGTSPWMVLPFTPNFVNLNFNPDINDFRTNPFERSNPLETVHLSTNEEDVWRFLGGATGTYDVWSSENQSLQLVSTFGVDYFTQENDLFFPPTLQFEPSDGLPGSSLLSNTDQMDLTWTGNVVHQFASDAFRSTTTAGFQYEDRELDIARIFGFGLAGGQENVDAATQLQIFETRQEIRDLGFFAQEELLLLDERLFLSAGVRADRGSANADTDQFFWYPKAAASYRFDDLASWLDGLKIRGAWGQSGNQPLYGQKFTPLTATNNITGLPGLQIQGTVADLDLQPEQQEEFEVGVDVTTFGGRAQITATWFQKNITDLLLQRTPAPSTGFATEIFNGGELEVTGWELALDAVPIQSDGFTWVSRTTFYADESEIVDLPVPAFNTGGFGTSLGAFRIQEGRSATQIVTNLGLCPSEEFANLCVDEDGNPRPEGAQIVGQVGDAVPDFRVGFSNDLQWGPLGLFSLFEWVEGHTVINLTQFLIDAGQNSADFTTAGLDRLLGWVGGDSRGFMEDASFIKLREVSLSYEVPVGVLSLLEGWIDGARLVASGRNLVTWTDYTGLDPEVSNFGNQPIARNIDVAPFPPSRSFWFGVDVSF